MENSFQGIFAIKSVKNGMVWFERVLKWEIKNGRYFLMMAILTGVR